jgi:hypothetical protein
LTAFGRSVLSTPTYRRKAGLALVFVGLAAIAAGRLGGKLTGGSSTQLGWKQWAALLAGIAVLAAGCVLVRKGRDPLLRQLPPRRLALGLLAALAVLLVWMLVVALDQSLWHDEAFTALHYVSPGPQEIFLGSYVPNNHVLFNALAWLTTSAVGESEVAYRFWSVVPALAAAVGIVAWSWRRLGRWVAVAVGLLTVTSPVLLVLAREARGYGLAMLAGVIMLVFADRLVREPDAKWLLGFGAAGLVGTATLPVFAVAFVGQALPLMRARQTRTRVAATVGAVGLGALALYAPLLGDLIDSAGQQFGRELPWHGPLTTAATDLLGPNVQAISDSSVPPGLPDATVAGDNAIAGAIILVGGIMLWRTGERMLTALVAMPLLWTYSVLTVARFTVEPRFSSFLLFHTIVLAACGVTGLIGAIPAGSIRRIAIAGAAGVCAFALVHAVGMADDLHDLPHENFKEAAEVARSSGATQVLTDSTRPTGLQYYLGVANVVQLPAAELQRRFCSVGEGFVYIDHPFRNEGEEPPPDVGCLERRGADFVRVRQLDRGGRIDVWTVP